MNKIQLTNVDQLRGKTIGKIIEQAWGNEIILWFIDDSFAVIIGKRDYDNDISVEISGDKLDLFDFSNDALIRAGFISQEELDKLSADRDREREARDLSYKRQMFDKLKKELG